MLIFVIIGIFLLLGIILGVKKILNRNTVPVACTEEAKICPDGSVVGRVGPKCEFSPCPTKSP